MLNAPDAAHPVRTVGIPRALLFHKYGTLWRTFFEEVGLTVVVSGDTTRAVVEAGDALSIDEACLASKVFMGHVDALKDQVDAVFIPSFASVNHRAGFCTKFQSLPDLVSNTFRAEGVAVISLDLEDATDAKKMKAAYLDLASRLKVPGAQAKKAYKAAVAAQAAEDAKRAKRAAETVALMAKYRKVASTDPHQKELAPPLILLVAHPYLAHDRYVCGDITDALEAAGAVIVCADEVDHAKSFKRSFAFSETLPWLVNRELAGAALELKGAVDGIVMVSAFPCGPDSLFTDALMRRLKELPILNLVIDAQSGSAGVQTRVESFIDILRFKQEGGYLDAQEIPHQGGQR